MIKTKTIILGAIFFLSFFAGVYDGDLWAFTDQCRTCDTGGTYTGCISNSVFTGPVAASFIATCNGGGGSVLMIDCTDCPY